MVKSRDQLQAAFKSAQALQQAGRLAEAEHAWIDLDKAAPGHAGVLANLAMTQWQLGRLEDAEANCARAIVADPNLVQARALHAATAEARGADSEAIERYEKALALAPEMPTLLHGLANLNRRQGRLQKARQFAERMVTAAPLSAEAHDILGAIHLALDDLDGADQSLHKALAINPDQASAQSNLGALLAERRQWDEALIHHDAALALAPNLAEAHNNRGNALISLGRLSEAGYAFDRALELDPDFSDAQFNQALLRLKLGQWVQAWPGFEQRWETRQLAPFKRSFDVPLWDGTPAPGQTVLIHAEQGMGDMMMVARYLPLAAARVGALAIECQAPLRSLLEAMPNDISGDITGDIHCFSAGARLPAFDLHLPAMSLPGVFGTTPETVPWEGAYLSVPESIEVSLPSENLKVGLAWAGNPLNPTDPERSVGLSMLAPLLNVEGCRFFSMQHGPEGDQIATAGLQRQITDLRPQMTDFAATAALVAEMDLVISICTSVAHLTGAMGKPLWIMLAEDADWRWLIERDDTPWYPSARLFRHCERGNWEELAAQVAAALKEWGR
jgi:tetratricopeptide (TPR) repeat protein